MMRRAPIIIIISNRPEMRAILLPFWLNGDTGAGSDATCTLIVGKVGR